MSTLSPAEILGLIAAGAGAGVMNALAGGGTLLTFPALLFLGLDPIAANATSTVALLPGAAASLFGYRREVAPYRSWLGVLALPSLLGGAIGSWLLLRTPARSFAALAPFLVLFATALFLVQGALAKRRAARAARRAGDAPAGMPVDVAGLAPRALGLAIAAQFAIAIYGGYFGAGIGILMLAVLGFLGLDDIHAMNGLKNVFGFAINAVAAGIFLARGSVDLPLALAAMVGAIGGGYGGARLARVIGRDAARKAVVAIGILVALLLFERHLRS
jgi:uncharacterized membrane protein YfcA